MEQMSRFVRFCESCHQKDPNYKHNIRGRYSTYLDEDNYTCEVCGNKVIDTTIPSNDYKTFIEVSNNPQFIKAMMELHDTDIVEYTSKMSQFKSQVQKDDSNKPHCPTCGSTNIEKISFGKKAFGGAMFGIFSSDVRNTMHCKNCGAKW